jgi:excisionase family DNA binding protein
MGDALTTSEAADYLELSAKRVRELALAGLLRGRQAGKFWLFDSDDLEAFAAIDRPPGWKKGKPRKPKGRTRRG